MSWLNLNESLNNIKGQISSFASGVLADGIVNDSDPFTEISVAQQKIQELQNLCASQDVEIKSLRRQNAELYEKLSFGNKEKNENHDTSGGSNGENWFWDPPTSDNHNIEKEQAQRKNSTNSTISDLTNRIKDLKLEKQDLIQSLEQLDQDCQRTTDKLVTLKDNLQTDYNQLKNEYDLLKNEIDFVNKDNNKYKQELKKLADEITKLKSNVVPNNNEQQQQNECTMVQSDNLNNKLYEELEIKYNKLCEDKKCLENKLETSKLNFNQIKIDYDILKTDFEKVNLETIPLDKHKAQLVELERKNKIAEDKIKKLTKDIHEKELSTIQSSNLSDDHKKLQDSYNEVKLKYDELINEKQEMHKKYVNILIETVKKYVDCLIPDEFVLKQNETAEISEFNSKVEAVLKLLLDFKWKTETLERKLCEISQEKTVAITEKNHEIEKLLHNSEILSQEVITKTQTIKHYEMECSELIKNNDLLIAELQQYKNNNGLQTISESNEDNLLLLETQLENANKRIRELELVINDMENAKQDVALETQTELDYIKKQLNMTGNELSQSKKEYQELYKLFKQCETDNKNLNVELTNLKLTCDSQLNENHTLTSLNEKMKSEIENTEYKFTEANVDLDTIREDYQKVKIECVNLSNTNQHLTSIKKEFENKIDLMQKEIDSLKSQLETGATIREQMEHQIRNLTEKLQSSKMSETGLKLQNDTIKRELDSMIELKTNFDQKIQSYEQEFLQISNAFKNLQLNTKLENESLSIIQKIEFLTEHLNSLEQIQEVKKSSEENSHLELENKLVELQTQNSEFVSINKMLETNLIDVRNKLETLESEKTMLEERLQIVKQDFEDKLNSKEEIGVLKSQLDHSNSIMNNMSTKINQLELEVYNLNISKTELVDLITAKHQENLQYHSEIQRLNQVISIEAEKYKNLEQNLAESLIDKSQLEHKIEEIDKLTDQNNFLKEKCEKLTHNLLEEQSKIKKSIADQQYVSEREQTLTKKLERLRMHLVQIEDSYTKELIQAEQKNQEMLTKVNEIEQRERDSSTIYTSVSIRANQQVETLQNQLQLVTAQRDDLQKKISEAEDKNNKQFAALTNLQCVLEQFQRDREKDIVFETERIRRQINSEILKQNTLQEEINTLKAQLAESKQGLKAASRLTEQMEKSKQQVLTMKDEVAKLQDQLAKSEEKFKLLSNKTSATVDKSLIKNLILGFIISNNNLTKDQKQILKIIATVLDFSQQDNDKLNLNKPATGWLSAILHPQAMGSNSNISQQSLSEAFVRFLENESQPKPTPPPLLNVRKLSTESNASTTSSTRQTPILLNEVVLPTFADFAQNRNSSSILKDVLKEN